MRSSSRAGLLAGIAGVCVSVSAALALPPIIDRAPTDALAVVVVPNFDALQKDVSALAALIGQPLPLDVGGALMMAGIEKGVKTDGSAALILFAPAGGAKEGDGADPEVVALIPVTDYAALLDNFGKKPGAAGSIDEITLNNAPVFVKDAGGGFAALSPNKSTLEGFKGGEGSKAAFEKMVGPACSAMADAADLSIIVNMPKARPLIEQSMKDRLEEMADQMAMMGGEEPNFAAADWVLKGFLADAQGAVATVDIDKLGAGFNLAFAFAEGSRMGKVAAAAGKATQLLGKIPGGSYLLAGAVDFSSPEVKQYLKDFAAQMPKDEPAAAGGSADFLKSLDTTSGASFAIGFAPGGVMGGILANTVHYTATTDPAAAVAATKAQFEAMEAQKIAKVKWGAGEKEIAGIKCDVYEARISATDENPMAGQAAMMLFGPAGGPTGYVAKVEGGVLTTMSKNSTLMASAISATKGEKSFGSDGVVTQVGAKMPQGRAAELYLGVKGVLDTVLPAAAMFGLPVPSLDIPETLPPIALSITPAKGTLNAGIYLPAPTIKVIADVAKSMQEAAEGMQGDEEPGNRPQRKETGQPGF